MSSSAPELKVESGSMKNIPRKFHFIWVGDESLRPDAYIETWREFHPDVEIKVWGNREWKDREWRNALQMERIAQLDRGYAGVADLMRWEILYAEGGVALDADSVCLQRLPDWLFSCDLFAVWENERVRPGLIANGYVGAIPGHAVIKKVIDDVNGLGNVSRKFVWKKLKFKKRKVWQTTGPVPFTKAILDSKNSNATILPSHFFLPVHHSGELYTGHGPVYACELFAGTNAAYEDMKGSTSRELIAATKTRLQAKILGASRA